jgi:hypothetical protein
LKPFIGPPIPSSGDTGQATIRADRCPHVGPRGASIMGRARDQPHNVKATTGS